MMLNPGVDEGWVLRIFGSWEAYYRSLPSRVWEQTAKGWASSARK